MDAYTKIAAAFAIFAKYDHEVGVAAQHDIILAGPDPDAVTAKDAAALIALDWHREYTLECWGFFV